LKLKPLTILVGPNGAGKSKILETIALCGQLGQLRGLLRDPSAEHLIHRRQPGLSATVEVFLSEKGLFSMKVTAGTPITGFAPLYDSHPLGQSADKGGQEKLAEFSRLLTSELQGKVYLLSATRGLVPHSVNTGIYPDWVGLDGENLIPLLARILAKREYDSIAKSILTWAEEFGVSGLKSGLWGQNTIGSDYLDTEVDASLNLASASSGARQIITVITQLFWSGPRTINMIEEPEISLHPEGQIKLCKLFAEVIGQQKQIIITTHSHFFLIAIGGAVQEGVLKRDQLVVYHVEKQKGRGTVASELELDENGYIKGWIPSYSDVEKKLIQRWADTLPVE